MVKAGFRFVTVLAVILPVLSLSAKNLADYQVGDKAEEDIVATVKLSFVDPDGTDALRQKEAQRVPVIIRYYTNTSDQVEGRFRQVFNQTRANFLESVTKAFGYPQLSPDELSSFKFKSLAILFQKQNNLFPLSTNRAALWASGDDDQAYRDSLIPVLRKAMSQPIRPELVPDEFKLTGTVRLIPLDSPNEIVTVQDAGQTSHNYARSNYVTIAQVRRDFQTVFPVEEREVGRFLSTLLTPNCAVDEVITRQLRAGRTDGLWSVCDYEPGQIILRRGDVITRKTKTALDQLKEKAVIGQLQDLQVKQQVAVGELQHLVNDDRTKGAQSQEHLRWLIGALAGVVFILAVAIWQLARRNQSVALVPMPAAAGGALEWQQRALVAEQRTENLQTAARAGLIAHLSQWMSRVLTQRLLSQRRLLIENQNNAADEMKQLEERLQRVQAPLQVRLAAYEHRIAELEKELAVRGEENRELLKAKIEMMRKQLEAERGKEHGKNRLEFN